MWSSVENIMFSQPRTAGYNTVNRGKSSTVTLQHWHRESREGKQPNYMRKRLHVPCFSMCRKEESILTRSSSSATESTSSTTEINSSEFSRYTIDPDGSGASLETAVMCYTFPRPIRSNGQEGSMSSEAPEGEESASCSVHLYSAVHLADKQYFKELQQRLAEYDRVLYEMVADKEGAPEGERWVPPGKLPGEGEDGGTVSYRKKKRGFIGQSQLLMARALNLRFQLDCLNYREDHWYHADLDLATFKKLSGERKETLLSLGRKMFQLASKALFADIRGKGEKKSTADILQAAQMVLPMPLVGQLVITGWMHQQSSKQALEGEEPSSTPTTTYLAEEPVPRALLSFDIAGGLKHLLAQQLCDGSLVSSAMSESVIIGERNSACMAALEEALEDGCTRVAVLYGGAHLPDLGQRLETTYGSRMSEVNWIRAWDLPLDQTKSVAAREDTACNRLSLGWLQMAALLTLSFVLATDLYVWEMIIEYVGHVVKSLSEHPF